MTTTPTIDALLPELSAYAELLRAHGFTVYTDAGSTPYSLTREYFHYSREVDGQTCYGTVSTSQFDGIGHTMPIKPSRLNGSSAIIGGTWGDWATLNLDNFDPLGVPIALAVARPSNWCPYNAEPIAEAVERANRQTGAPKKYYRGARLDNYKPSTLGAAFAPTGSAE